MSAAHYWIAKQQTTQSSSILYNPVAYNVVG